MMANTIKTPSVSGRLTPKLGYLVRDTIPKIIKPIPIIVFIFLNF